MFEVFYDKHIFKLLHIQNIAAEVPTLISQSWIPLEHLPHTTLVRIQWGQLYEALISNLH